VRARRALLVGLYCLGVALFVEAALRAAFASDAFFRRVCADDDASWRLAWLRDRARRGGTYAGVDAYHRTRGWTPRPSLAAVALRGARASTNSKGLRGRDEHAYAKPAGLTRIVALGDSFTFGEEVDDGEPYPARLAAVLPGSEVLNLGVHGYGHDQMLLYLEEEGLRYQPDVVVLGFVGCDMARDTLAFRDFAKPRFVLERGRLELRGVPVPSPEQVLARERWRPRLFDVATMLRARVRHATGAARREREALTTALLDRLRSEVVHARATPVLLYVAVGHEIARAGPSKRERWFRAYCDARGVTCVDPTEAFRERLAAGASLRTSGHWDAQEHELAARALAALLVERHLVPAPAAGA
jgi:hypothetical protein